MPLPDPEMRDRIRAQFDYCPYPQTPIDVSHERNPELLYIHNLVTPYYQRYQQVINTEGKWILDAGCGTGLKALALAQANPGAHIIGIDISAESVEFASKRLQYHGFDRCEFYPLSIEDLAQQSWRFDYINCDEVLYLLPDPLAGLQAMRAVLKPDGIIRTNLHSLHGRSYVFRLQEVFAMLGALNDNPGDEEVQIVIDTMTALRDEVIVKRFSWRPQSAGGGDDDKGAVLANALLVGDKGYTVPQFFELLRAAELEFVEMVCPQQWLMANLFKEPENLPVFLGMGLLEALPEEKLALYELLNPANRLIDLWCSNVGASPITAIETWTSGDWQRAVVYIHPQLNTADAHAALQDSVSGLHPLELSRLLPNRASNAPYLVDSTIVGCILLPLLQSPQPLTALLERWQQLRPLDPLTLASNGAAGATAMLQDAIAGLVASGYLLVERSQ